MKRLLISLLFAASACATAGAERAAPTASEPAAERPTATASSPEGGAKTCDDKCLARRRDELDRLLKLGTPAVTVAQNH